jgi:hypothetical protein
VVTGHHSKKEFSSQKQQQEPEIAKKIPEQTEKMTNKNKNSHSLIPSQIQQRLIEIFKCEFIPAEQEIGYATLEVSV